MATSTRPDRRARTPRGGRFHVGQLIVAEAVLAAVVLAYRGPGLVFAGVLALGLAVLLATFGRSGGRAWLAHVRHRPRYALRGRRAAAEVLAGELGSARADPLAFRLRTLAVGLDLEI